MEKDPKIISMTKDGIPSMRKTKKGLGVEEFSEQNKELKDIIHQMEDKLQGVLNQIRVEHTEERTKFQREMQKIIHSFEKRITQRFQELDSRKESSPQERRARMLKQLGNVFRKIINVPDFEFIRRSEEVDEFGLDPSFEEQCFPIFRFFHDQYWRVETQGVNNIPDTGRALIVANHSGTIPFDGAMIKVAVFLSHPSQREVRFLVEDFVYHFPFLGLAISRFGGVRACQENAERLLLNDNLVTVFPEGVKGLGKLYRNRYRVQRFGRGGVIRLALKTQTPIIPAAVIGAEEIYPLLYRSQYLARPLGIPYVPITPFFPWFGPLGLFPLPSKWSIHFDKPITFDQYGPEAAKDPLLVSRLNEELRTIIQEMIKDRLTKRLSVWFG